jgi:hypothetical protein
MKIRANYVPEDDSLSLFWTAEPADSASEVAPGIVLSYDKDGTVVGIELESGARDVMESLNRAGRSVTEERRRESA